MRKQQKDEERTTYLLQVCLEFIEDSLNMYDLGTVVYDNVECDGLCLVEDIKNELDIEE